jgi:hypothetical protein
MNRTNMGVQRTATKRNRSAEKVSHYILSSAIQVLEGEGSVQSGWDLHQQYLFESALTRDRWDHQVDLKLFGPDQFLQLWGQTTCYKGHDNGATEANKTYEIRETLTEALCLRACVPDSQSLFLVHITFGNPDYVYSWFRPMKESVFDISIYVHDGGVDVFELIDEALRGARTEIQERACLDSQIASGTPLGELINSAISQVVRGLREPGKHRSALGPLQASIISANLKRARSVEPLGAISGQNIKKSVVDYILSESGTAFNQNVVDAAEEILGRKPFLRTVKAQLRDWSSFLTALRNLCSKAHDLHDQLALLWAADDPAIRESARRILVRLHSTGDIEYAQDFGIAGMTEHNLYSGKHTQVQMDQLVRTLEERFRNAGINHSNIYSKIDHEGKKILRSQLYFEARNGTTSKSSFELVLQDLRLDGFEITSPREAGIKLIGYHAEISGELVRPYTNFKIISDRRVGPLCVLKAKFFSAAEFDRRCKEEGFVGLSLKNRWTGEGFSSRFNLPLIMCVDMPENFAPPAFSVLKMRAMGWDVVFGVEELKDRLGQLQGNPR